MDELDIGDAAAEVSDQRHCTAFKTKDINLNFNIKPSSEPMA
jgi:hypothetical protein